MRNRTQEVIFALENSTSMAARRRRLTAQHSSLSTVSSTYTAENKRGESPTIGLYSPQVEHAFCSPVARCAASGCRRLQAVGNGCRRRLAVSGCRRAVAGGCRQVSRQASADGCRQSTAGGCGRQKPTAGGCKPLQAITVLQLYSGDTILDCKQTRCRVCMHAASI